MPPPGQADVPPGVVAAPGVYRDVCPRWSADGTRIAFLRRTTDRRLQVFLAASDLSRVGPLLAPALANPDRPLASGRASYRAPEGIAWGPGDRSISMEQAEWITFDDGERLPGTGLWTCDVATRRAAPIGVHPHDYEGPFYYYRTPAWSADGRHLAFIGESTHGDKALFVRPLPGSNARQDNPRYDQYDDVDWPAWSPDGRRLAFRQGILRAMTADPIETVRVIEPGGIQARRVFAMTPQRILALRGRDEGTGEEPPEESPQLRPPRGEGVSPRVAGLSWSPDGRWLAFSLTPDPLAPERCSLWVVSTVGPAEARKVSPDDRRGYLAPVWIGLDRLGALRTTGGGEFDAVEVGIGAKGVRVLCRLPGADMDWSPDRRWIVCASAAAGGVTTLRLYRTGVHVSRRPRAERGVWVRPTNQRPPVPPLAAVGSCRASYS